MNLREKFHYIEAELNAAYFERQEVIRGLLVGLLSKQHVLFLGAPGTAKSLLAEDLCGRIGGQYFRWLLTKYTTPEEIFGPVSLKALEQDSYRRVTTGKLPEATIAFIDETFKANSAILNALLSVLNERLFFNDGQPISVLLQMCVGASNELPEDRAELEALWDRFLLRYLVKPIRDPRCFEQMMLFDGGSQKRTALAQQELIQAQAEVQAVKVKPLVPMLVDLRQKVADLNIPVSDRRWKQSLDLLRAQAWLEGRAEAKEDDLAILAPALWAEPGQIAQVRQLVMSVANPFDNDALDLLAQAEELFAAAISAPEDKTSSLGIETNAKMKRMGKKLDALRREAEGQGKASVKIQEVITRIKEMNNQVVEKCLKITGD